MIKEAMYLKNYFLAFTLFSFVFLFSSGEVLASTLYLSPKSGNIAKGGSLSVQVRVNTSDAANAVSAYLSYPADKIEVKSISYSSSAFSMEAESMYGGGSIKITRGSITGVTGDKNLATITFREVNAGTASVSFVSGSVVAREVDSSDSLNLGASTGGTYTVGGLSVSASTAPVPTGANNNSSSKNLNQKDIVPPQITGISATFDIKNGAVVSWVTDENADSEVEYGPMGAAYTSSVSKPEMTTNHKIIIKDELLKSGSTLHFKVISADAAGNVGESNDTIFKLQGNTLKIRVTDGDNKPFSDASVSVYKGSQLLKSLSTNTQGEVIFNDLESGRYTVMAKMKNQENSLEFDVKNTKNTQILVLKMNRSFLPFGISAITPFAGVGAIFIIGIIFMIIKKVLGRKNDIEGMAHLPAAEFTASNKEQVLPSEDISVSNSPVVENKVENMDTNTSSGFNGSSGMTLKQPIFSTSSVSGLKNEGRDEKISDFAAKPVSDLFKTSPDKDYGFQPESKAIPDLNSLSGEDIEPSNQGSKP